MANALHLEFRDDGTALLTFDQPGSRANTLNQGVLGELEQMVAQLKAHAGLHGVILQSGKPGMFIAGADLKELGSTQPDPNINRQPVERGLAILAGLEALPCPTVALIDGSCMGGGTELALGFDYRLAGSNPKVDIALPEVKVGLIPGWGGTQRLTRLIGPALAAEMICSGEGVNAQKARQYGIVFDAVPSERLLEEALRLLAWSRASGDYRQARQRRQQPVGVSEDQLSFTMAVARGQVLMKTRGQLPAPLAALEAIAGGCNLPLEAGLQVETEKFLPLVGSPISKNLIAVFFMQTKLARDPGISDPSITPQEIEKVGVIGSGLMGAGIAGAHIRRGLPTIMTDVTQPALDKGMGAIVKVMQSRIEIGRMTQPDLLRALSRLTTSTSLALLNDRQLIIEAIVENESAKLNLLHELQAIVKPGTLLASNTSTISITRLAKAVNEAENFAGLHFFNPVDRMQLVEVIRGAQTSDQTVASLVALARKIGKTPIVVRDCPGFLVNRILFPYLNESFALLEEGADPRLLDRVAEKFGMPMGPITLNDLVGLDTSLYAGRVIAAAFPERTAPARILDELVKAGRLGKKTGAGFYNYAKGSRGADDPVLGEMLARCRQGNRSISAEEIQDRLFLPMLVEASLVLMEGIVREPADVDMGLILGIGFPVHQGGLLRWADNQGLPRVLERLARYEHLGPRFQPTLQMKQLAIKGQGFYSAG